MYFIEKGISLLRKGGLFSYIVANKWIRANYGKPLRSWLKGKCIEEIVDFGDLRVFTTATTYPCVIRVKNDSPGTTFQAVSVENLSFSSMDDYVLQHRHAIEIKNLDDGGWTLTDAKSQELLKKIQKAGIPLGKYVEGKIFRGILTGLNKAFIIDEITRGKLIREDPKSAEIIKPFLVGKDVKRYQPPEIKGKYLIFTRHGIDISKYPAILEYLRQFKKELMPKPKDFVGDSWPGRKPGAYEWYEIQDTIDYYQEFERPKIIIPAIVKSASYAFDDNHIYSNDKTSIIPLNDKYLLGFLNSKVADYVIFNIASTKQGGYFEYKPMYLSQLPIRTINFSDPADKARHDKMVTLVERMLALHKKRAEVKIDHEKNLIEGQIEAIDKQIDALVYELYGLTEEEIRVVNGNEPR